MPNKTLDSDQQPVEAASSAEMAAEPQFVSPADPDQSLKSKITLAVGVILILAILLVGSGWLSQLSGRLNNWVASLRTTTTTLNQKVVNEESLVIDVAKKTQPSVVSIGGSQTLSNFLGNGSDDQSQGIGTGFILNANGVILTNKHVVSDTTIKYSVVTNDGKKYDVKQIYRDPAHDLAIIKIDVTNLTPLEQGDSSKLQVGQFVIAIGNALGEFSNTVTTGVVSGLGRGITAGDPFGGFQERLDDVIQTDAAINPGNSGGPLLNSAGQVIGINTAVSSNAQNIGFAIPINVAKPVIDEFNRTGKIAGPPFLGVGYQVISQRAALLNSVPQGMYLTQIVSDSPAAKAGLQTGDIVTKIDGQKMTDTNDLAKVIQTKKIGDTVTLEYYRDGETKTTKATLVEAPAQ
jgi:S1-C subfamily serine protease